MSNESTTWILETLGIIIDLEVEIEFDEYGGAIRTLGNNEIEKSFIKGGTSDLDLIEK